jgi:putative PEP-CTERM system histidine kinase
VTGSAFATAALWSYGLAAAGFVAFAIRLALGWRRSTPAMLLLAAVVATAMWAVAGMAVGIGPTSTGWLASNALDMFRYGCWFAFLASLLETPSAGVGAQAESARTPRWVIVLIVIALLASVALSEGSPVGQAFGAEARKAEFGVRLGLAIVGLILVEQLLRRVHPHARWSIKPLCVGLAGLFGFDLFMLADAMLYGHLDPDIWVARGVANLLVIPFVAISTARNPAWRIEMHLSRGVVLHSTALLVSGLFVLVVAVAGYIIRFLGGDWGRALQIELLFAAALSVALVASSGRFRSKLSVFISKHFFSYRFDYRAEWLRFTRTLAAQGSVRDVEINSVRGLADLVESPGGALWLREDDASLRPASRWNMAAIGETEPADGSLARFLERTAWIVNVDECRTDPSAYPELVLPDWLRDAPLAWLVVPLITGTELLGFVVLATPRTPIDVNWEVRDLLKTASRQAASYLSQIRATEALLEARKFDAFNRMSAFVVHDLKNLVAQLSLMLRNFERHRDNPEFQRDMLSTVAHVVEKMNQLMMQLRMGSTPVDKPRPIELAPLVSRVCAAKAGAGGRMELELPAGVLAIGHEERVEHVIGHIVQNALDATAAGGAVTVRLLRDGRFAAIEVADTGPGMSPEFVRDKLFKPFATTKAAGMGIGVYESSQYLTGIGGKLAIDTAPGAGTRVRVLLPAGDEAAVTAGTWKDVA